MAVIDSAFETKGTNVYFVLAGVVTKLTCPTGVTGIGGGTKDKIDTTCLDETSAFRTNIGGFADPAEIAIPFILYDGDAGHIGLMTLQQSGAVVGWYVGLSDSPEAPTIASDGLESHAGRTGWNFEGYVSNLTFDAAVNEVVRGSLTVQPSGFTQFHAAV